jgi:hypothetical protein
MNFFSLRPKLELKSELSQNSNYKFKLTGFYCVFGWAIPFRTSYMLKIA